MHKSVGVGVLATTTTEDVESWLRVIVDALCVVALLFLTADIKQMFFQNRSRSREVEIRYRGLSLNHRYRDCS